MGSLPTSPAASQALPEHCPCCEDCGWLPFPYGSNPGDYIPCPRCTLSEARWTTADCLPVQLFVNPRVARDDFYGPGGEGGAA